MIKNFNGEVEIHKIETNNQLADTMTKGLVEDKFAPLHDRLMGWDLVPSAARPQTNLHSRGSIRDVGPTTHGGSMQSRVGFDVCQVNINVHTGGHKCLLTDTKLLYVYTKMSMKDLELSLRDSQSLHL